MTEDRDFHARLGERVRCLRSRKRMSQDDVCLRAGVARNTLSNLENGHAVSTDTLFAVAVALGVCVHDLVKPDPSSDCHPM